MGSAMNDVTRVVAFLGGYRRAPDADLFAATRPVADTFAAVAARDRGLST